MGVNWSLMHSGFSLAELWQPDTELSPGNKSLFLLLAVVASLLPERQGPSPMDAVLRDTYVPESFCSCPLSSILAKVPFYRDTPSYCSLPCWTSDTAFLKSEGWCTEPASSKSDSAIFPTASSYFMSLCPILATLTILKENVTLLLYLL